MKKKIVFLYYLLTCRYQANLVMYRGNKKQKNTIKQWGSAFLIFRIGNRSSRSKVERHWPDRASQGWVSKYYNIKL